MPLSKAKNRDRMREIRLHAKKHTEPVQPNIPEYVEGYYYEPGDKVIYKGKVFVIPGRDADGNPIPEYQ